MKNKKNEMTVYNYRYTWKVKDNEKQFFVKFFVGTEEEHKKFMSSLIQDENVIVATRIYINEVNVSLTEQHEFIKKEQK